MGLGGSAARPALDLGVSWRPDRETIRTPTTMTTAATARMVICTAPRGCRITDRRSAAWHNLAPRRLTPGTSRFYHARYRSNVATSAATASMRRPTPSTTIRSFRSSLVALATPRIVPSTRLPSALFMTSYPRSPCTVRSMGVGCCSLVIDLSRSRARTATQSPRRDGRTSSSRYAAARSSSTRT